MANLMGSAGKSGDLFDDLPTRTAAPLNRQRMAPELMLARGLCRQFRYKQALPDKQRIAHLICLNLRSMLTNGPQRV